MLEGSLSHCLLQAIIFINVLEVDLSGRLMKFSSGFKLEKVKF